MFDFEWVINNNHFFVIVLFCLSSAVQKFDDVKDVKWTKLYINKHIQQRDSISCGVYVCKLYTMLRLGNLNMDIPDFDPAAFRRQIATEISKCALWFYLFFIIVSVLMFITFSLFTFHNLILNVEIFSQALTKNVNCYYIFFLSFFNDYLKQKFVWFDWLELLKFVYVYIWFCLLVW